MTKTYENKLLTRDEESKTWKVTIPKIPSLENPDNNILDRGVYQLYLDYENKTGEQLANEDLYNVVVCDKWVVNVTPRIVPYTTSALANTDITRDEINNTVMSVPIAIYNSDDVNTRVPLEDLPFEIYFLKGELPDYYNMDEKTRNRQLKDDLRRAYAIPNAYSFSTIKQGDVTSTGNPYTDADIGKKYLKFKIGSVYNENETIKEKNTILLVCKGTTDRDINVMPDIIPIPLILGTANIWQMIKPNTLTSYGKGTITWNIASSYAWCRRSDGTFLAGYENWDQPSKLIKVGSYKLQVFDDETNTWKDVKSKYLSVNDEYTEINEGLVTYSPNNNSGKLNVTWDLDEYKLAETYNLKVRWQYIEKVGQTISKDGYVFNIVLDQQYVNTNAINYNITIDETQAESLLQGDSTLTGYVKADNGTIPPLARLEVRSATSLFGSPIEESGYKLDLLDSFNTETGQFTIPFKNVYVENATITLIAVCPDHTYITHTKKSIDLSFIPSTLTLKYISNSNSGYSFDLSDPASEVGIRIGDPELDNNCGAINGTINVYLQRQGKAWQNNSVPEFPKQLVYSMAVSNIALGTVMSVPASNLELSSVASYMLDRNTLYSNYDLFTEFVPDENNCAYIYSKKVTSTHNANICGKIKIISHNIRSTGSDKHTTIFEVESAPYITNEYINLVYINSDNLTVTLATAQISESYKLEFNFDFPTDIPTATSGKDGILKSKYDLSNRLTLEYESFKLLGSKSLKG